ncbi:hypothetical protein MKY82_08575 [Paenibacillus sp. FSL W7-1279]|uniref:hypothetical protein n=1 Tax=Paenibacillus sp. FSL W7-1279 TaxID=2921697 RepID=UPI0030DB60DC
MAKTDWTIQDSVLPKDMNQIGQEINDLGLSATVWLGTTEGSNTAYTVTSSKVSSLFEGLRVSFRAHIASGTNPTLQINSLGAVPLKKPNGRVAKLDADGVYTLVYDGTAFILQGEGGEYGSATAADVLAPKTIGTDNGIVTGTIPTQGNQFKSGLWSNPDGDAYVDTYVNIDGGYYPPGTQVTIQAYDPNLVSNNIRAGAKVLGVDGAPNVIDTYDDYNPATSADIVKHKRAFVNGQFVSGDIENYKGFGLTAQLEPKPGAYVGAKPHHSGLMDQTTEFTIGMPNKLPENIRKGVDIGGTVGTLVEGTPWATGTAPVSSGHLSFWVSDTQSRDMNYIQVSGLSFQPSVIVAKQGINTTIFKRGWNLTEYKYDILTLAVFTNPIGSFAGMPVQNRSPVSITNGSFLIPIHGIYSGTLEWWAFA